MGYYYLQLKPTDKQSLRKLWSRVREFADFCEMKCLTHASGERKHCGLFRAGMKEIN